MSDVDALIGSLAASFIALRTPAGEMNAGLARTIGLLDQATRCDELDPVTRAIFADNVATLEALREGIAGMMMVADHVAQSAAALGSQAPPWPASAIRH